MAVNSKQYTAHTVPNRVFYQLTRIPLKFYNAPATWHTLIENVLDAWTPFGIEEGFYSLKEAECREMSILSVWNEIPYVESNKVHAMVEIPA